ncbi:MAG TPA: DUF4430 domain-containing protein [Candidatus Diapherotrites archaeon]|uniref:DUF4430 domain-containing protein n=1 Tax=Candidatus Iainarchaeum sp. TaxID=3101447 RepID=A0A7J4IZM2_9ARCH|nr:DUF4430 domain-containing protein [Candidatus Diapherotrites archaeon]
MKKLIVIFAVLMLALAGCSGQKTDIAQKPIIVQIKALDKESDLVYEKRLNALEGQTLLEMLRENNVPIETQDTPYGAFLNGIGGISPSAQEYISIYVNGQYAQEGIGTLKPKNNDLIEFGIEEISPDFNATSTEQ